MNLLLTGRYLSLPAGDADWLKKIEWLASEEFVAAQSAGGFLPAIEWKGKPPTPAIVEQLRLSGVFWGIHAPNNFADIAHDKRADFLARAEEMAKLRPSYVVIHGGLDGLISGVPFDEPVDRYRSPISTDDFHHAWYHQVKTMEKMIELMSEAGADGEVLMENTSVTEFVGCEKLPTYCHPRTGNWIEVSKIAKSAGAKPLCDIGHLTYGYNFYWRLEDYANLPPAGEFNPATDREYLLWDTLGIGIRKGEFPVVRQLMDLAEAIEKINADYYHLDAGFREESNGVIATHAPIEYEDDRIRGIIGQILKRENCLISLEVDGSRPDGSGPFPDRRPTEELQASSWHNLCRICTELA